MTTDCLKLHKFSLDVPEDAHQEVFKRIKLPCARTGVKRAGRAYFRRGRISGTLRYVHYCSTFVWQNLLWERGKRGKGERGDGGWGEKGGSSLVPRPHPIQFYVWGLGTGLGGEVVLDKPCSGEILLQMFFNIGERRWML